MTSATLQENLYGAKLEELVPQLTSHASQIEYFFSTFLSTTTIECISDEAFFTIEEKLQVHDIDFALTKQIVADLEEKRRSVGMYLSEETAARLLEENVPVVLESLLVEHTEVTIDTLTKLAISRYTEGTEWKKRYEASISKIELDGLNQRAPACVAVPDAILHKIPNLHTKPWGLSHSKETGLILQFSSLFESKTPLLLKLAVTLHYWFEVEHSGEFIANNSDEAGQNILLLIHERETTLPFLPDRNAHDETLYWQETIEVLTKLFPEMASAHTLAASSNQNTFHSHHFVDRLWNINSIRKQTNYTYHLAQELWTTLVKEISHLDTLDYREKILNAPHLSNQQFLSLCLR